MILIEQFTHFIKNWEGNDMINRLNVNLEIVLQALKFSALHQN